MNRDERKLTFDGRYAVVGKVLEGQTVSLTFPIFERAEKIHVEGKDYVILHRGNDVVAIQPGGKYVPFYQRAHYRMGETLYRKVT